ncbi:MAG: serine/threonine protein kinase [Acidobacteria bacterium]|nr:serine/threonine protein kinase [Acidobacteriota bacterium]MBV9187005.1 serine/threonine protein kinase [Acidobacteriota bacterium]
MSGENDSTLMLAPSPRLRALATLADKRIGRYQIRGLLGEGGMGSVYLAEQHEPIARIVALKLMRSTLAGPASLARFAAERQALARLSHPNVAAMYDAGATDDGFPYFVMEHVQGSPLVDYCDEHRLSIRERIKLLLQVCKGVQHAHQKGIIHRDLKPSNVLVADVEGRSLPKIIDFGIAKAIDDNFLGESTAVLTGIGVVGTPAYMSPEALSGDDLDTRTDVYSLGVIMYELLTGARPHRVDDLPLAAVIRTVAEHDALPPHTLFRTMDGDTRQKTAAARNADERSLAHVLARDLGWIARKATAREREERYGSAADLAADLTRFLDDEPVLASPPSLRYRAAKFARRHRGAVVAAALILLAILGGIAGTTIGMLRAQRARAEAEAVSSFLTNLLDSASPWNRKNETTVRELLHEAAGRIATELKDQPAARAELLSTIGSSEFHLGHLESAEALLREALRLRIQTDGPNSPPVAGVLNDLGLVRKHQDHLDDAERLLRESIAIREKSLGHINGATARGLFDLASVLAMRDKNAEAEAALRESLNLRERLSTDPRNGVDLSTVALTMSGLGQQLARMNRLAEAESIIRRSLVLRRRAERPGYAYALATLQLGKVVAREGRLAEAETLDREGLTSLRNFVERGDHRIEEAEQQLAEVVRAESVLDRTGGK